jgi:nickel-dependent lactate racemase
MLVKVPYGQTTLSAEIEGHVEVVSPARVTPMADPAGAVRAGLERPIGMEALADLVRRRKPKTATILVSDATRPVPNEALLTPLLNALELSGLFPTRITVLIATGLHRASTAAERQRLLGPEILRRVRVVDHDPRDPSALVTLSGKTPAGATVSVNRLFAQADLKLATGAIEPHFMLGYSGGRKSVCPGIVDLKTVERLHGPKLLGDPRAAAGVLDDNPCHREALAVARMVGVDLIVNVTLDHLGRTVGVYVGELEAAHLAGVRELEARCRAGVTEPADIAITSAGGFPLDGTFYQAVKGFVAPLSVVRRGGVVLCCAACKEGVGSDAYRDLMLEYAGDFRRFLRDIARRKTVTLDQWEYQMHARVLTKLGVAGLYCLTDGIDRETLSRLSVSAPLGDRRTMLQETYNAVARRFANPHIVVLPDGPYCIPVLAKQEAKLTTKAQRHEK